MLDLLVANRRASRGDEYSLGVQRTFRGFTADRGNPVRLFNVGESALAYLKEERNV